MISTPHISIVTPVYNEQECLETLKERVDRALANVRCRYDVYLIDDGSLDRTPEIIRRIARDDPRWHGVFLARNFGHQAAISAGLAIARGDVVVVMDGDLQDAPEAIPEMLERWQSGYDVVYAVRTRRKESVLHRLAYWTFYRLLNGMSEQRVPVDAGDFCLMSRRVVDALNALPERNRFVRGLRAWVGFRQIGIEVERGARVAGRPKYTLVKLIRLAADGVLDFSWMPLRAASIAGFVSIAVASIYLVIVVALRLLGQVELQGWTTVVFLVIWFGGMNLMSLGIIGEYLGRTYAEAKRRPMYIIASTTDEAEASTHAVVTRNAAVGINADAALVPASGGEEPKCYATE